MGIVNLGTIYFWNSNLGTMSQNGKYQNTVFHSFAKLHPVGTNTGWPKSFANVDLSFCEMMIG